MTTAGFSGGLGMIGGGGGAGSDSAARRFSVRPEGSGRWAPRVQADCRRRHRLPGIWSGAVERLSGIGLRALLFGECGLLRGLAVVPRGEPDHGREQGRRAVKPRAKITPRFDGRLRCRRFACVAGWAARRGLPTMSSQGDGSAGPGFVSSATTKPDAQARFSATALRPPSKPDAQARKGTPCNCSSYAAFLAAFEQKDLCRRHLVEQALGEGGVLARLKGPQMGHLPVGGRSDNVGIVLERRDPQQPVVVRRLFSRAECPARGDRGQRLAP